MACKLHNIDAKLILGTIGLPGTSKCFPSAWVEIEDNIYDLAIYFDTLRHPVLQEEKIKILPQINVPYDEANVDYFDFQFIDIFAMSDMNRWTDKTFKEFCNNSPMGDDIWCDILYAANISQTKENYDKLQDIASNYIIKVERD